MRQFVRSCLWITFACCVILDGAMGEAAISGYGDVGHWNTTGTWSFPGPNPELWPWIAGLVLLQGSLIVALFRLREPSHSQSLFSGKPIPKSGTQI
jgi:hypothetical protein